MMEVTTGPKTPLQIRLDPGQLAALDAYIARFTDFPPSRVDVVRKAVHEWLAQKLAPAPHTQPPQHPGVCAPRRVPSVGGRLACVTGRCDARHTHERAGAAHWILLPPCLRQGRCTRERWARTRRADTGRVGGRGDAGGRSSVCTPSVLTGGQCRARVPRSASTR